MVNYSSSPSNNIPPTGGFGLSPFDGVKPLHQSKRILNAKYDPSRSSKVRPHIYSERKQKKFLKCLLETNISTDRVLKHFDKLSLNQKFNVWNTICSVSSNASTSHYDEIVKKIAVVFANSCCYGTGFWNPLVPRLTQDNTFCVDLLESVKDVIFDGQPALFQVFNLPLRSDGKGNNYDLHCAYEYILQNFSSIDTEILKNIFRQCLFCGFTDSTSVLTKYALSHSKDVRISFLMEFDKIYEIPNEIPRLSNSFKNVFYQLMDSDVLQDIKYFIETKGRSSPSLLKQYTQEYEEVSKSQQILNEAIGSLEEKNTFKKRKM